MRAVLLALAVAATAAVASTTITFKQCTDLDFCRADTCQSANVLSGTCMPFSPHHGPHKGKNFSQVLKCDDVVQVCGTLWLHNDVHCGELLATDTLVCNQCDPLTHRVALCSDRAGKQQIEVFQCDDSKCSTNCRAAGVIPADQCFHMGNGTYAKYSGAERCTTVDQYAWSNTECHGTPYTYAKVPNNKCLVGGEVTCQYA